MNSGGKLQWSEDNGFLEILTGKNFDKEHRYKIGGKTHKWLMRNEYVPMNEFGYELTASGRFKYVWRKPERQLINQLRSLNEDNDVNELKINLNILSVERIAYLISTHLPISNNQRAFSIDFGNNEFYIYNEKLNKSLLNAFDKTFVEEGDDEFGSDVKAITRLFMATDITIRKIIRQNNIYDEIGGEFFNHINTTKMDLSDFGVFNKKQFHEFDKKGYFKSNCLCHAIVQAIKYNNSKNLFRKTNIVESLKIFFNNSFTPKKKVHIVFKALKLNVDLRHIINKNSRNTSLDKHRYGKETDPILKIGLLDNHYFAIKPTIYSYKMLGKNYKGPKKDNVDSWKIINFMLKNKYGLRDLKFDEKITTHFYTDKELGSIENEIILTDSFEFKEKKTKKKKPPRKVYFDCETITKGETHEVYMCDYVCEDNTYGKFDGKDCCKKFLNSFREDLLLIAHNANYDIKFLIPHLFGLTGIFKGKKCIGASGRFVGKNGKNYNVTIKDSYNLISSPLRSFGKNFNLKMRKEFMPYALYDEEIYTNPMKKISDAEKYCKNDEEKNLLHSNIKKWKLSKDGIYFDALQYSHKYCLIDCLVLRDGYTTFRKWIIEQLDLNVDDILTSASLAQTYMEEQRCFDDCYMLGGACRAFIQKSVVGGRCMSRNNKKYFIDKKLADYDAVSLYPSAMERLGKELGGYLKGVPKLLQEKTMDFLNGVDGYFIKIRFKKDMTHKYSFPLLSYFDGVSRTFSNNLQDKVIHIDKISLEDVMKFHKITEDDFEIIEGYYFDEGRNNTIKDVIRKVFDMRLQKKKEKNPIQSIYKLIMNSAYGKTLLNPYDTELKIIDGEQKCNNYILKNHNRLIKATKIHNSEKFAVKESVPIIDHYNYAHIGVEILSMSKRIMNEVMCLAEDNNINIYYQDTDSMHIEFDKVAELEKLYLNTYGKILNGKNMGQFHIDFDSDILKNEIYSSKCVILGKKCYMDVLEDGSGDKDYHFRMKGIPHSTIKYTAGEMNLSIDKLYEYNLNNAIEYDLLEGGNKCKFLTNENMSVSMAKKFTRNLNFGGDLITVR